MVELVSLSALLMIRPIPRAGDGLHAGWLAIELGHEPIEAVEVVLQPVGGVGGVWLRIPMGP